MPKTANSTKRPASATPAAKAATADRAAQQVLRDQVEEARRASAAAARARREIQIAADRRRRRVRQILTIAGAVSAVVLLIGGLAFWYNYTHPGESFPDQGNQHVTSVTQPHIAYNSFPPTSGPHLPSPGPWGVYAPDKTPPKEEEVHDLEDAGVVIHYRPGIDAPTLAALTAIVQSYDNKHMTMRLNAGGSQDITQHVILMAYPGLQDPIVLTAWTRMQRFQTLDEGAIRHFIDMYRGIDHHSAAG